MRLIDRNRGIITTKVLMGNVSKNTYNITTNFNNTTRIDFNQANICK